jgi:hypothetical protein
MSNILVSHND